MFTKKGVISIAKSAVSEDKVTEIVLEAGAEDLSDEGENWEVLTDPKDYEAVTEALKAAKITPEHAEVTKIASTYTKLEGTQAGPPRSGLPSQYRRPRRHPERLLKLRHG